MTTHAYVGHPDVSTSTFTLSPGTAMLLVGDGLAQAITQQHQSQYDYANTHVDMLLTGLDAHGTKYSSDANIDALSYFEEGYTFFRPSVTNHYTMMVSFLNNDDVADTGTLRIDLSAAAISDNLPAIPEPASVALMLVGLGAIGWRRRRNSSRAPA